MNPEQYKICVKLYERFMRLMECKQHYTSDTILEYFNKLYEECLEEFKKSGITMEQYRNFREQYFQTYVNEIAENSIKEKCLNWMRFIQGSIRDKEFNNDCDCITRFNGCKPDCKNYIKANNEQIKRFEYCEDVDTGEPIDIEEEQ